MSVTPIWTVASSVSGSSWRRLTRAARWLPSVIRASISPRLADRRAISLPEKKPLQSRQKKIAATRKPHSCIGPAILSDGARAAALSALLVFDSVKPRKQHEEAEFGQ